MMDTMRKIIDNLKALQDIDLEIQKLRREEERWPAVLDLRDREVETRMAELETARKRENDIRVEISRNELRLKELEEEITRLNVNLNTVKTNKEYTAILNEIANKKSEISSTEEEILERMDLVEQARKEVEQAAANVESAREEKGKIEKQAEEERKEIHEEMEQLQKKREDFAALIPEEILEEYEKIAEGRQGIAVASVADGVCQGCFINLTAQEINLLMGASEIIRCKNCSRILYLEQE